MSADLNFNVAMQHIKRELHKLQEFDTLKEYNSKPLEWSQCVIQAFTDYWDMNEVEKFPKQSHQLSELLVDFVFTVDQKMDDNSLADLTLGLVSCLYFIVNLHCKINGNLDSNVGQRLVSRFKHKISAAHLAENIKDMAISTEEVLIEAFQRELRVKRLQRRSHEVLKEIAIEEEFERLANLIGANKFSKPIAPAKVIKQQRVAQSYREDAVKSTAHFQASSSREFTFSDREAKVTTVKQFTFSNEESSIKMTGSPEFAPLKRKYNTEARPEKDQPKTNLDILKNLFQEKIPKLKNLKDEDASVTMHPVQQTFQDPNRFYEKFEQKDIKPYNERFSGRKSKNQQTRQSDGSVPSSSRRSLANSSHRHLGAVKHNKDNVVDPASKYYLNINNCPDFDYFQAKFKKRVGMTLNSADKKRLLLNKEINCSHSERSMSVDSRHHSVSKRHGSSLKKEHKRSRSISPDKLNFYFEETLFFEAKATSVGFEQWENEGIIALRTPPSEQENF